MGKYSSIKYWFCLFPYVLLYTHIWADNYIPSSFFFFKFGSEECFLLYSFNCALAWWLKLSMFFMCEKELITSLPTKTHKDIFLKTLSEKGEWSHVQVFTDFVLGMC